jgi:Dirigent-like protein
MEVPAVDQNVTAAYTKNSSALMSVCEQKEANFHLYLHQNISGPNKNQTVSVNSTLPNGFGAIAINDWDIREGPDRASKLVARAHGLNTQSAMNEQQWYISSSFLFEDDGYMFYTMQLIN